MHRFFLPPSAIQSDSILFPSDTAHQILRVLRLHSGDQVTVLDGLGWQYRVELTQVTRELVAGKLLEKSAITSEAPVQLSMYLCLTQREKFEWILQKCTEVGVTEFTPVFSSRSLVQDAESQENKFPRWQRILQEAAEQSGRGIIPVLNPPLGFTAALESAREHYDVCLTAWEGEHTLRLQAALNGCAHNARVALLIGPEGGLSVEEVTMAEQLGWKAVSLGPRILRMETAAVVSAALVIDWFESRAV
jgi:16S rRNA (uracil1498-N3)-methyltransferase